MKNLKIFGLFLALSAIISSCAKYDEGSNFSLISAKKRLINSWTMSKYEVNNVDQTSGNPGIDISFYKDGTFKRTFIYGFQVSDTGTWGFANAKEYVTLTKSDGTLETYKIIQLKNKDLKVERYDGSDTYRYTFKGN